MSNHASPGAPAFRKSSHSGELNCVEVATNAPVVLMRSTRNRHGSVLAVPPAGWNTFLAGLKGGDFRP